MVIGLNAYGRIVLANGVDHCGERWEHCCGTQGGADWVYGLLIKAAALDGLIVVGLLAAALIGLIVVALNA